MFIYLLFVRNPKPEKVVYIMKDDFSMKATDSIVTKCLPLIKFACALLPSAVGNN